MFPAKAQPRRTEPDEWAPTEDFCQSDVELISQKYLVLTHVVVLCHMGLFEWTVSEDIELRCRKCIHNSPTALPRVLRYAQPRNETYKDVFGKNCLPSLLTGSYIYGLNSSLHIFTSVGKVRLVEAV